MHTHEKPTTSAPTSTPQVNPVVPGLFEVRFPNQVQAASLTNPFPRRSCEVWTPEPVVARKPDTLTELLDSETEAISTGNPTVQRQSDPSSGAAQTQRQTTRREPFRLYAPDRPAPSTMPWWGVQTKVTIGPPNDAYEQEADRVAAQVMSMAPPAAPNVQRQDLAEEEPESIQTKLLAETITPLVQRQEMLDAEEEPEEPVQAKFLQRDEQPEDEESSVQRKPIATVQSAADSSDLASQLQSRKGSGSPLAEDTRSFMESRFNTDFSHVRVHTDATAVQMNKDLSAQAFTHGSDVYFGTGKAPGQNELTAHELTHVVQQTGPKKLANVQRKSNKLSSLQESETDKKRIAENNVSPEIKPDPSPSNPSSSEAEPQSSQSKDLKSLTASPPSHQNKELSPLKPTDGDPSTESKLKTDIAPAIGANQNKAKPEALTPPQAAPVPAPGNAAPQNNPASAISALTASASTSGNLSAGAAPSAADVEVAQAPAIDTGGGAAEAGGEAGVADDPELETTAAVTESVELDSADRSETQASMAEVADVGGAAESAGGGGGGGGGGGAIPNKPAPPVPDVSAAEPSQALATISQLPPAQLQEGLAGVAAAVGTTVTKERTNLAATPPEMERPSGSPVNKEGAAGDKALPSDKPLKPVEKAPEGAAKLVPPFQPVVLPPSPLMSTQTPPVQGGQDGKVSAGDVQALKSSVQQMPTRDPGLNIKAEAPPPLELKGDADPKQAQEQKVKLEKGLTDAQTGGQKDLAQPMGEQEIYPKVPKEILKAQIGGGSGGAAAAAPGAAPAAAPGPEGDDAVSIVAQQEHGAEIQSAVAQAQAQMTAQKQEHVTKVAQEKEKSNQEISKLQADNSKEQEQERAKAQTEVTKQRADWNKEQTTLLEKSHKDSDAAVDKGMKEVEQEQTQAQTKAQGHIDKGNQDAEKARLEGEEKAATEKQKSEKDSGGVLGWLADKAKSFFDGIKQAIQKAFEIARAAVKAAIDAAKKLATKVIEAARKAIVVVIRTVGDALIKIGDVMLAAFPEMRDRFRNAIKSTVDAAEKAVNALAATLKQGVQAALDLLGKGLDAALGLLEKGYLLAIDIASKAVQGAISAAKAAIDALGVFAALIKDIASGPSQWLSNLAAGVMDGIRNHLWTAFQTAVKEWFNSKVEEVLGLGMTIWNVLSKGGINLAEVGKMAWEGIKAAIPPALIQILIEKLVAMIIPAAGAVMVVIESLQAAWGTVSRILQAMERFVTFLKAVKTGQSGPQFGAMLASAGVVVIDFVANWLLKRVRGAASKVAGKIKAIAKKIGNKLKKTFKKLKQKFKRASTRLKKKFRNLKEKIYGRKGKSGDTKQRYEEKRKRKVEERFEKGIFAVEKYKAKFRGKQTSSLIFKAGLALIRVRYRFTKLELVQQGSSWAIDAVMNPRKVVGVDHSTILKVNELNPSNPPDAVSPTTKAFGTSARGSTLYYCTDGEGTRWYWRPKVQSPTEGRWIKASDNKDKAKAEAAARDYLISNNAKFVSLVADDKGLTSRGVDAGGFDPDQERLILGESKHSGGKNSEYVKYVPPDLVGTQQSSGHYRQNSLSATTDNLTKNIADMSNLALGHAQGASLIRRIETALRSGKVTVIYFLAGQAKISKVTLEKVEDRIRAEISNLLKNRFKMSKSEVKEVIGNVEVKTQNISI